MSTWLLKMVSVVAAVSVGLILIIRFSPPLSVSSIVTQKNSLFTVTGTGKMTVVPDTAIINLGISVTQPTVKSAQNQANSVIKKISDDAKSLGVEPKYIQTNNYSISPQYNYQTTPYRITGYQVTASLTVTVKDFDNINRVIDTATADGANTVSGIQLTVDETKQKELLNQARIQAVNDAKSKAANLASAAGITLGRIVNVEESGNAPVPVRMYATADLSVKSGGGAPTGIEPGSTDITTTVTLSYETR